MIESPRSSPSPRSSCSRSGYAPRSYRALPLEEIVAPDRPAASSPSSIPHLWRQVHALRRSSRPSRYARPRSAARSCAVMSMRQSRADRLFRQCHAHAFFPPGGPSITLLASWIPQRRTPICRSSSEAEAESTARGLHRGVRHCSRAAIARPSCFHFQFSSSSRSPRSSLFLRRLLQQFSSGFHRFQSSVSSAVCIARWGCSSPLRWPRAHRCQRALLHPGALCRR